MDYAMLTERKRARTVYANYLSQLTKLDQGCADRVQLESGAAASDENLALTAQKGAVFTSFAEYLAIVAASTCASAAATGAPVDNTVYANPTWAIFNAGVTNFNIRATAIDSAGNVFIAGFYNSSSAVTLQNADGNTQTASSYTLPLTSGADCYLVKYNSSGQVQWGINLKGAGTDTLYGSIATDGTNVYIAGAYSAGATNIFVQDASGTGQTNSAIQLPTTSNREIFIIKYNASGLAQWAANIQGVESVEPYGLTVDSAGGVYMVADVKSTSAAITITNGASTGIPSNSSVTLPTLSTYAIGIIKWNTSGATQWATYINGAGDDAARGVTIDSSDNIIVCGSYNSNGSAVTLFNASGNSQTASSITLGALGANSGFVVAKYNSSGAAQWATYFVGTGGNAVANSIRVDSSNNCYVGGSFNSSAAITLKDASGNAQADSTITLPSTSSTTQYCLVKYNSSGVTQWAVDCAAGTSSEILRLAIDSSDNIYVSGDYQSATAVTLRSASGTTQTNSAVTLPVNSTVSAFLIKYDSSGSCGWATYLENTGTDVGYTVSASSGAVYFGGLYSSAAAFNIYNAQGTSQAITGFTLPAGTNRGFLVKYLV